MATASRAARATGPKEDLYIWEGKDKTGKVIRGEIRATGDAMVQAMLRRQGIQVIKVRKQKIARGGRAVALAHVAIHLGGVGLVADRLQVGGGDVGDEPGQDRERQLGIGQAPPGIELGARHLRVGLGQVEAAVGGEAAEQDVAELRVGGLAGVAAGGEILHVGSPSG